MQLFFKKYFYHLGLLAIGLGWLLLLIHWLSIDAQTIIFPDAGDYNLSATNLYHHFRGHCYRPMLMAAIYGFPLLFGATAFDLYTIAIYINIVLWLVTILILFEIVKNYLSIQIAFMISLGFIFFISNALFNFHLLAETPFLFFLLLGTFFLQKYHQKKTFTYLVVALSIIVLSMLIKPASKFFVILLLLYFIQILYQNYKQKIMLVLYSSIALCFVQAAGLKYQFGDFTISYIDSVTFHNYLFSKADCYRKGIEYEQIGNPRAELLFTKKAHEQKQMANQDIKEQLLNNKINLLKAYFHNFLWNTASGSMVINAYHDAKQKENFQKNQIVLYWISKYQNRFMTLLGIFISLWTLLKVDRKDVMLFSSAILVLYIIGISGISSDQGDRFHLITYPFTLILIANYLKTKPFFAPLQK